MTRPRILILAILSIVLLLAGATVAMADHSAVNGGIIKLLKSDGSQAGTNDAYSPKQTCAGCHITNCTASPAIPTNIKAWCENDTQKTSYATANPTTKFADYGSGVKHSAHTQGVIESDNQVYWQSYDVTSFEHGVSVGRHSNNGRNEDYSTLIRTVFGDPFFTSSPGMFGKY
jgi:hypothetical protein